ncbi:protein-L-isoaspartate O-methyltransferase [Actinotalea sp. JY-7885]|uniref:protein-L-isoaspartate O-methyltransferase family protein n=1 Tax=Actinotalea sp. JY-7885 TaxID=2758576 RepID=UPI00165E0EDF|nr:protein-L-isoaspartate carboxylmethyltransferase [Actinotalea sp. JY-7885]
MDGTSRRYPDEREAARRDRVAAAMAAHGRRGFLRRHEARRADVDQPLPIGHGQTSSQPSTVARMLRALEVPVGARVLDVGAGSGWTTALLAHLVGPDGVVVGVELEPDLVAWGGANLAATGQPWARVVAARPGVLGLPDEGPWDRVLVSAEARELPAALVGQLADGGIMVIPVAGELLTVARRGPAPSDVTVRSEGPHRFVPLR